MPLFMYCKLNFAILSAYLLCTFMMIGGPLGELVQWSDLIAALYVLGHNLTITAEDMQLHWQVISLCVYVCL